MSKKYDGWCLKNICARNPFLCTSWFCTTRKKVIEEFERLFTSGEWRNARRKGEFKIVKVRLVEVE